MNESKRFTLLFNDKYYYNDSTDVFLSPLTYETDPDNLIHFEILLEPKIDIFVSDIRIQLRSNQYKYQLLESINKMAVSLYGDRFIKDSVQLNNMGDIMWFFLKEV